MRSSAAATLIVASRSGKSFRACSAIVELKSGILTASLIARLYAMNNSFAAKNVRRFAEIIADISLLADPIEITADAGRKIDFRRVTGGANPFGVAGEMTHFAGTEFSVHFRRDLNIEGVGDLLRDFANAHALAAAHVDR